MNNKFKITTAILFSSLLITPISSLVNNYDNIAKSQNIKEKDNLRYFLKNQLKINNKETEEIIKYLDNIKKEAKKTPEARERGRFSFLRVAFKIFVRHVDALPSAKFRKYVRQYGDKIIDAVDYIESNSIAGATIAYQKVGIPYPQARLLAEITVFLLL